MVVTKGSLVASAITERNAATARTERIEALLADKEILIDDLRQKVAELSTLAGDAVRRSDYLETRARYAEGRALDDGWVGDHARKRAEEAAMALEQRCRAAAASRQTVGWQTDTGGTQFDRSDDLLCWLLDRFVERRTPTLARGRELLACLQTLGFATRVPEAMAMQLALREVERLQIIEEARDAEAAKVAAAIEQGEKCA